MTSVADLEARLAELERRVQALESGAGSGPGRAARAPRGSGSSSSTPGSDATIDASAWSAPYEAAQLEVSETWIELHEVSARPQLQRLIRAVVDTEGPVTERLTLDRIRRAWGLRRAGGRVQEAFEQALRQLVARGLVLREGDALVAPNTTFDEVRVPGEDEESRRGAEDVPMVELALALTRVTRALGGSGDEDDVSMRTAKLFGWSRRGGAIQERLDAALDAAERDGALTRSGGRLRIP